MTQKDRFVITTVGNSTKIHCGHDDISYHTILWYRQESNSAEKELQPIGYSIEGNPPKMEDSEDKGYKIERPSVKEAFLSTPVQKAVDPAVYFCAASKGTVRTLCLTAAHEYPSLAHASIHITDIQKSRSHVYRVELRRGTGNRAAHTNCSSRITCKGLQLHAAVILKCLLYIL